MYSRYKKSEASTIPSNEKNDLSNLKPYIRKRRHVSYSPLKVSRTIIENNPFPIYGPEGIILASQSVLQAEKTPSKQVLSVKQKLAQLAEKKHCLIRNDPREDERIRLKKLKPSYGEPTIISHRVASGIRETEAKESFEKQVRHVKGAAVSSKKREALLKKIQLSQSKKSS